MKKHHFIAFILFCLGIYYSSFILSAPTSRPQLPQVSDLRVVAQQAKVQKLPILLMFGTDECPFCQLLREDFLIPMIISGDYTDKIILREIHISARENIIDFSGHSIPVSRFAQHHHVSLFPTMVFIDSSGQALVKPIVGITTPSLFGGTLDEQIDRALEKLRQAL